MRFIHIADVHLGAEPYVGNEEKENKKRAKELYQSLERILDLCENEKIELLLIAGDLFHRQPLKRDLKELNYLFSKLSVTKVVMIAGNHDYLRGDSYYRSFAWEKNVHMILSDSMECVEFPEYGLAVYGMSYTSREILEERYKEAFPGRRQGYEILLAHGGDSRHIPMKQEDLLGLGYDYIALGHIHKPQIICPDKIAYAGALEPIDKNDTGAHGYIYGELSVKGTKIRFVPFACREYIHMEIPVKAKMTGHELKEVIRHYIRENGVQNIYKLILTGARDPEMSYDLNLLESCGNIIEIIDDTIPAYSYEKLKKQNKDNILGKLIEELEGFPENSIEYQGMCEGVQALMETRRG